MAGNSDRRKRVAVIGLGNVLHGDDGFGVRVIERLREERSCRVGFSPRGFSDVDLIDGGSLGVDLIEYLTGYDRVIIVDAADMGLEPGELRTFTPDEVRSGETGTPLSLHSADVLGTIHLAETLGEPLAAIHIIAVQPASLAAGEGLSRAVGTTLKEAAQSATRAATTYGR